MGQLVGIYGSPGHLKNGHIDLAMPTIKCEIVGDKFPPPFQVDCSKLNMHSKGKYGAITLADLKDHLAPYDGLVKFSREYGFNQKSLNSKDVVMCYNLSDFPEKARPTDYEDPNFMRTRYG